jgi:hypothetical protein
MSLRLTSVSDTMPTEQLSEKPDKPALAATELALVAVLTAPETLCFDRSVIRKPALPVDAILPEVLAILQHTTNLVIEAPPETGKTTRVPPAVLGLVSGEVIVLEPRRIAARLAAQRVAWERGEVGGTVGYQVRFEERIGPRTRLRFVYGGHFDPPFADRSNSQRHRRDRP